MLGHRMDVPERPLEQTAPVIRRGPGRGEDDVDRRGRAPRRIGRRQQEIGALGQGDLPVAGPGPAGGRLLGRQSRATR